MEIGDIINIKKSGGGYWNGKIVSISDQFPDIITINELNGPGHATINDKNLEFKDGEYFEIRL